MIRVIALTGCWGSEVVSLRKSDALSHKSTFFSQSSSLGLNRQIAAVTTARGRDARAPRGLVGRTPLRHWGEVQELAGDAVFLASEAASFVAGQTLLVDGGMTSVLSNRVDFPPDQVVAGDLGQNYSTDLYEAAKECSVSDQ